MPRGSGAKMMRQHNKAMARGNNCKGSAYTTNHQVHGRKYSKGFAKTTDADKLQKLIIMDGEPYQVIYKFHGIHIEIISWVKNAAKIGTNSNHISHKLKYDKDMENRMIHENLTALTTYALRYNKIKTQDYITMIKEGYIVPDHILLKKKLTEMITK